MRVVINELSELRNDEVSDADLAALYAAPQSSWLRVNMVSTVDGAATGASGKSGSINNDADKRVFFALRKLADAIVVGAGTARIEGYRPADVPTVLISRSGEIPESLLYAPAGSVIVATLAACPVVTALQESLGRDNVLVLGDDEVDLARLRPALAERGLHQLLSEGGPHLLRDLVATGVADEVCTTTVPRVLAGDHFRIAVGSDLDADVSLKVLLEEDGTLLARWFVG